MTFSHLRSTSALLLALSLVAPVAHATHEPQYHCVGNPPRQAVDPLSPPCVPFFDGDNGGATAPGVTATEITFVLYNDLGISGDLNAPYDPVEDPLGPAASYQERYLRRTVKALLRHFVSTYQTYGRHVRVIARASIASFTTPCTARISDAMAIMLQDDPFGVITLGDNLDCFVEHIALLGRPVFAYGGEVDPALQARYPGLIWSFLPDLHTEVAGSAAFICDALVGTDARFATDPTLSVRTRRFGLIYPSESERGPQSRIAAELLQRRVLARCGLRFARIERHAERAHATASDTMLRFKLANITTIVCYCVPVQAETHVTRYQNAARSLLYLPEWYWDPISRMDKAMWQQTFGDPAQASFGVSNFWRQPAFEEQFHARAYQEQEPGTIPNERFSWDIYHAFMTAFVALQSAGPNLNPDTVRRGLATWFLEDPSNPFVPRGSLERQGRPAPFSFLDAQTAWWWDPTGTPPDGRIGEGCVRLMTEGRSYLRGAWPDDDAGLFAADAPCSGANQRAT